MKWFLLNHESKLSLAAKPSAPTAHGAKQPAALLLSWGHLQTASAVSPDPSQLQHY